MIKNKLLHSWIMAVYLANQVALSSSAYDLSRLYELQGQVDELSGNHRVDQLLSLVDQIENQGEKSMIEEGNGQEEKPYFNIINLNGQALSAFKNTFVLAKIEEYAFNYTQEKGYAVSDAAKDNQRIRIKDLFDMISGISTSTLLATGLSVRSPEHSRDFDKPHYDCQEFISFQQPLLKYFENLYPQKVSDNLTYWFLMFMIGLISQRIGKQMFDSSNISKSYNMLNAILNNQIQIIDLKIESSTDKKPSIVKLTQSMQQQTTDNSTGSPVKRIMTLKQLASAAVSFEQRQDDLNNQELYSTDEILIRKLLKQKWKDKNAKLKQIYKLEKELKNFKKSMESKQLTDDDYFIETKFNKENEINQLRSEFDELKQQTWFQIKDKNIVMKPVESKQTDKEVQEHKIHMLRKKNNFDHFQLPKNGVQLDNQLINFVMLHKKTQIIDGCFDFITGGQMIKKIVQSGLKNKCKYNQNIYNEIIKPYKPNKFIEKQSKKYNLNYSTSTALLDSAQSYQKKNDGYKQMQGWDAQVFYLGMAQRLLSESKGIYSSRKPLKWFVLFIGLILGQLVIHPFIEKMIQPELYSDSMMQRVQTIVKDIIGPITKFPDDVLVEDIFLPGFEIGKNEPYFFSKKIGEKYHDKYNFKAYEITRATFQYPGTFLKQQNNDLSFIDPNSYIWSASNLAYLYARHFRNQENMQIRILNVDPGIQDLAGAQEDFERYQRMSNDERKSYKKFNSDGEHLMKEVLADKASQDWIIEHLLGDNYIMLELPTVGTESKKFEKIKKLKATFDKIKGVETPEEMMVRTKGQEMYAINRVKIEKLIRKIVDERFMIGAYDDFEPDFDDGISMD